MSIREHLRVDEKRWRTVRSSLRDYLLVHG